MWELDCEESWVPKNWCFWTVVLEKTLESPLDCKEVQPVHPKGDQSWVFIGGTDVEAETPVLWLPHAKSWLIGKDCDAGRNWGQEEKGMTEDEMAGWQHQLDGHEFVWTLGVSDGQGGLACCDPWGRKESDMTEQLNWTELNWTESISIFKIISFKSFYHTSNIFKLFLILNFFFIMYGFINETQQNFLMLNIDDMEHLLRGLSTQMSKLFSWAKFSLILPKAHIN